MEARSRRISCELGIIRGDRRAASIYRCDELRATLPIGRVVLPKDVAALAVHPMTNTALTAATYHIDGGSRLCLRVKND